MAPGPAGGLWAAIPMGDGSVLLVALDSTGQPRPGWPVVLDDATTCGQLLPVDDGSVRIVCTPDALNQELNQGARAYAFDSNARALAGWPVAVQGYFVAGRVIDTDLTLYTSQSLGDVIEEGQPASDGGLVTIAADGAVDAGARVPDAGSSGWLVGPDGVAYGGVESGEVSQIGAVDRTGMHASWPRSFDGFASVPAFAPDGRIVLTVGSPTLGTTDILAFERDGDPRGDRSVPIPILTVDGSWGDTGGCPPTPRPPLFAQDGTAFLYSEADPAVFAIDPSLRTMRGWPYEPRTPLALRDERYVKEDAYCPSLAIPAVGPEGTVYLPLQAHGASVGGSIVAVGTDGRVRPGWPVELKRPGAEFWSVVVGGDGTVYALAIEPESSSTSSASILAIAPDSIVRSITTIIEP